MQLRRILIRGPKVDDASVTFEAGPNILAGESDTGKSYLLHCLDYIFGADALRKRIPQAEPYAQLFVEFENDKGDFLTLERSLSGGDLAAHRCRIEQIDAAGERIAPRRHGTSQAVDVTSVLFPFANLEEARLRVNADGRTQRLTIRTFAPTVLVDEISIIAEQSPMLGKSGYDRTARQRMFAFMLTGKDDRGVIAAERSDIATARLSARLSVISDLLAPIEQRLKRADAADPEESIERIEATIASISENLARVEAERDALLEERERATEVRLHAETQVMAIDELLARYRLLDERYGSDLDRLDFLAEGAHYFEGLQEVKCPLCDQLMSSDHIHAAAIASENIYASARAEAAKILGQRCDLKQATASLEARRAKHSSEQSSAVEKLSRIASRLSNIVHPALQSDASRLQALMSRRIELETTRNDHEQHENLQAMKEEIARASASGKASKHEWEALPTKALRLFCNEIEAVLRAWQWKGDGRVDFDIREYDIIVDGQSRQSHGKGVRAVLYSAFVIALLRFCQANDLPHPGFVVIDSPLTSYKRGGPVSGMDDPIDAGVEAAFWASLPSVGPTLQIIIVENKEPPSEVAAAVHYEWFAGETAGVEDRVTFIPPPQA